MLWEAEEYGQFRVLASITLARGGWHDAPLQQMVAGSFRKLVEEIADKPDAEVRRELDYWIPEIFKSDGHAQLRAMIDSWDLLSDWRMQVVEDAFLAHTEGKYTLSVPALLPQVEGALRKETGDLKSQNDWIYSINRALGYSYERREPPPWPTQEDVENALAEAKHLDFAGRHELAERASLEHALHRVNELYNRVEFDSLDPASPTNRHAILHGVSEHYDEIDSLKVFCAIELMHEVVAAYRESTETEHPQRDG